MLSNRTTERSFQARIEGTEKGRVYVVLPFDPEKAWGLRARYHVRGTINGMDVRGALVQFSKGYFLPLGPAYRRGAGLQRGDLVIVMLIPEGPQIETLAANIVAALEAEPEAASMGCRPSIAKTTYDGLMRPNAAPRFARNGSPSLSS